MGKTNLASHTLLKPENCNCDKSDTWVTCPICEGGLNYCTVCHGGEIDLIEKSCDERLKDQQDE